MLAYDLRHEGKSTACVAVKIRYPDFSTQTRQKTIALTANDSILIETAHELFGQVYDGRRPLRLLGVRFSELNEGSVQTNLFGDTEKETRLLAQLDKIRDKFGSKSVVRSVNSRPKK